jgi:hypothetical protein
MMRMEVSPRLARWIHREFPKDSAEGVLAALRQLSEDIIGGQDPERIQASLVIRSGGSWEQCQQRLKVAESAWRDAIVGAGPGNEDWPRCLDDVLGTHQQVVSQAGVVVAGPSIGG